LLGLSIPLPPLSEQRTIAHILRAVQAAREARQREVSLERERKAALMAHLFTHGTRGEPTKQTTIGEIPVSWEVVRLAKCAYIQTGTTKGRRFKDGEPTIEVPYLRVANVQDGYLDLSEIKNIKIRASEYDRYRLQAGDVLMTEGGDADKLGRGFIWNNEIGGCVHQNHVFAVRVNKDLLTPEFLSYQTPWVPRIWHFCLGGAFGGGKTDKPPHHPCQ
jgi:type I restriction enzyme S subunit